MSYPPLPIGKEFNLNKSAGYSWTDTDIAALGFTPMASAPPGTPTPPTPPTGFWAVAGQKITDYIVLWIYKRMSYLIIIGALNGWEED